MIQRRIVQAACGSVSDKFGKPTFLRSSQWNIDSCESLFFPSHSVQYKVLLSKACRRLAQPRLNMVI